MNDYPKLFSAVPFLWGALAGIGIITALITLGEQRKPMRFICDGPGDTPRLCYTYVPAQAFKN